MRQRAFTRRQSRERSQNSAGPKRRRYCGRLRRPEAQTKPRRARQALPQAGSCNPAIPMAGQVHPISPRRTRPLQALQSDRIGTKSVPTPIQISAEKNPVIKAMQPLTSAPAGKSSRQIVRTFRTRFTEISSAIAPKIALSTQAFINFATSPPHDALINISAVQRLIKNASRDPRA